MALRGPGVLHRVDRIGEVEAGQRQAVGKRFAHGHMAVRAGRALKRDRALGRCGGRFAHLGDQGAGGGGETLHQHGSLRDAGAAC
jgi:hypothetical protein